MNWFINFEKNQTVQRGKFVFFIIRLLIYFSEIFVNFRLVLKTYAFH